MLNKLIIKNYALIQGLNFEPSPDFNIITGETGAGKSILLGAIGLLTGARADTKVLKDVEQKCIVEAEFAIKNYQMEAVFDELEIDYQENTTIRREISPQGKSRSFINDTPVILESLKKISDQLIDIHSQHDNILLGENDFQLELIDAYAGNKPLLKKYQEMYFLYKKQLKVVDDLIAKAANASKEFEYENYLFKELEDAALTIGEQDLLELELTKLENVEEIKFKLNQSLDLIQESEFSILKSTQSVAQALNQLSKYASSFEPYSERIGSILAEIKDIANELQREEEKTEPDPARLLFIRERLNLIYKIQKKHGVDSLEELATIHHDLAIKIAEYETIDSQIAAAKNTFATLEKSIQNQAQMLTNSRTSIFNSLASQIQNQLSDLGMPNNNFIIQSEPITYSKSGCDKIVCLFSANKGIAPIALKNAASGGEFSRLMFVIKNILADRGALPTMIFDEIDTGISGDIALKMAQMMQHIASKHQLICITHLPQIAAKGNSHFFVYKDETGIETKTNLRKLSKEERIKEIAEMIGGKNPSTTTFESAKELLLR